MKKQYVKPTAEFVNMKLFGSVLEEVVVVGGSNGIIDADSKENTGLWDDVDDEERDQRHKQDHERDDGTRFSLLLCEFVSHTCL